MRIDPNQVWSGDNQLDGVKGAANQPQSPNSGAASQNASLDSGDTVELSGALGQVQQLNAQLSQVPDVRSERVAALQQQIQQGTYQPSDEQIANTMYAELFGSGNGS